MQTLGGWLNYHHLYYFKIIANEGAIAKASQRLRLGQPTLSAQLKSFEENLGFKLFERRNRRLILTEPGRVVLEYANEIFKLGNEMVEVLNDRLIPSRIHVAIGALDSVPKHVILSLVKECYRLSNCTVSVLEGGSDDLLRELALHRIDLVLTNHLPNTAAGHTVYSRLVKKIPVVICGVAKFKNLRKDFPKSLNGKPMILPTPHSKLRMNLEHYFQRTEVNIDTIAETQDVAVQKLLGLEGFGLVAAPLAAVATHIQNHSLFEIGRPIGVFEEIFLVSSSRKIENPVSSKIMKNFELK